MKGKFATYERISTASQSLEIQTSAINEYVAKHNLVVDSYSEIESSRNVRVVKRELMKKLKAGEYEGVIFYRLDRFARSSKELITDVEALTKLGVKVISIKENLDLNSSMGRLMFHFLSILADYEKNLIRERVVDGIARAKANGKKLGRPVGSKDSVKRKTTGYYDHQQKLRIKRVNNGG